jgi:cytochrome oxidase assembly protein ShyY1
MLTPRWVAIHVAVAGVAALFVGLGFWQLDRLEERQAFERVVAERQARAPAAFDRLPGAGGTELEFRRVVLEGQYVPDGDVVLIGRALEGRPGNHVLTPLSPADGPLVVVDRGWVPFDPEGRVPSVAEAPGGTVRVSGVLLPGEGSGEALPAEGGRPRTLTTVDLALLEERSPARVADLYLHLTSQDPAQAGDLPLPSPVRALQPGPPHLSYAIQWFAFAAIGAIGYAALLRRERRGG